MIFSKLTGFLSMMIGSFRAYFNSNVRTAILAVNLIKANVNDATKDFRTALTTSFPTNAPQLLTAVTNALTGFTLTDSADSTDPIADLVKELAQLPEPMQDCLYNKLTGLISNELAGTQAPANQYQTDTLIQLCYAFDKFNTPVVQAPNPATASTTSTNTSTSNTSTPS